jgi:hypothetical protein
LLEKSLYQVLLDVALDPGSTETDIFQALAEILAVQGRGFAYLHRRNGRENYILQALFGAKGTIFTNEDIGSSYNNLHVAFQSSHLAILQEKSYLTFESVGDMQLDRRDPSTKLLSDAFNENSLALVNVCRAKVGPALVLLSSAGSNEFQPSALTDFARGLSIALDIGLLKSNLVGLRTRQNPIPSSATAPVNLEGRIGYPELGGGELVVSPGERIETDLIGDPAALVQRFADHLAVALTNVNSSETASQRASELTALYDMALEIAGEQDLRSLMQTSLRWATNLLNSVMGAVFLVDPTLNQIALAAEKNLPDAPGVLYLDKGFGLAGMVWEKGRAVILDHQRGVGDPQWIETCYGTGSAVGVPLLCDERVPGVLVVYEPPRGDTFGANGRTNFAGYRER